MSHRIQLRRDKAAFWAQENPVLAQGELAWVSDTGALKIGDGVTPFNELPNILGGSSALNLIEIDFPDWDELSEYEPNTLYVVTHQEGDDEPYEYQETFLTNLEGDDWISISGKVITEDYLFVIPNRVDTVENPDLSEDFYAERLLDFDRYAIVRSATKDSSGYYKKVIQLNSSDFLYLNENNQRSIFVFTGTADGASQTFGALFLNNNGFLLNISPLVWMDNREFAFINKSSSIVILDPENAGLNPPTEAEFYTPITWDKVYNLNPGEFVLLRLDSDLEIFRQEKQAGGAGISQADLDEAVASLAGIPRPLSVPRGYLPEVNHTFLGLDPLGQLGFILPDAIAAVNAGASMVLEINLNYYLKPNGTLPSVKLKIGNIEVKLPSGNIPGATSILYFDGMVTLFIHKPASDTTIKAMTRFRSYESFDGGELADDLVHFPGDYLGNDEYTVTGNWATDGAWANTDPFLVFDGELNIKGRLEKASGQYSLAF